MKLLASADGLSERLGYRVARNVGVARVQKDAPPKAGTMVAVQPLEPEPLVDHHGCIVHLAGSAVDSGQGLDGDPAPCRPSITHLWNARTH